MSLEVEPRLEVIDVLLAAGVVLGPARAGGFLLDLAPSGPIRAALRSPLPVAAWREELCGMIDTAAGTGTAVLDALELVVRERAPSPIETTIPIESE